MTPTRNIARRTSGFTLTEMLVTMLIMVLASTLLATGVPVAVDTYQKTVNSANAQVALSTTITVLRSEYGMSSQIQTLSGEDGVVYYMTEEGYWAIIRNPKDGETYKGLVKEYIKSDESGKPLPSGSLDRSLGIYPLVPDAAFKGANKPLNLRVGSISTTADSVTVAGLSVKDGTNDSANELANLDSYTVATRFAD